MVSQCMISYVGLSYLLLDKYRMCGLIMIPEYSILYEVANGRENHLFCD